VRPLTPFFQTAGASTPTDAGWIRFDAREERAGAELDE
jgi:hypothetical protein